MSRSNENQQEEDMQIDSDEIVTAVASYSPTPYGEGFVTESETFTGGNRVQNEPIVGPSDSNGNILVRLNDDCIIQVFEYLPLCDLCNVADVCRAFESNTLSVFIRRHSDLDLDEFLDGSDSDDDSQILADDSLGSSDSDNSWNNKHMKYTQPPVQARYVRRFYMETVKALFRHFGAYIKKIEFTARDENQNGEILVLMATYCTSEDAELTELIMNDVTIEPHFIPRIQCLFDRLTCLKVTGGQISSVHIGPELTELILEDVQLNDAVTQKLEKLHALTILNVDDDPFGALDSLLLMSTQLKRLSIRDSLIDDDLSVVNCSAKLEELELDFSGYDVMDVILVPLENLKVLSVNYHDFWITEFFNKLVEQNAPVEELYLTFTMLDDDTAKSLVGLNKIKKLSLAHGGYTDNIKLLNVVAGLPALEKLYLNYFGYATIMTIDVIKSTIENAPKLKEFVVNVSDCDTSIEIHSSDYNKICQLIRKRLDQTKLALELSGVGIKLNVPESIIESNKLWLKVTVITYKDVQPVDIVNYYGFSDDSESTNDSD